ncbi:iron chelate uptake ABC transporter family permease subunit [Streptomyces sp. NPDC088812]|uniref:iron chelate uptake ABC transporter family permease subunit n=1 Tax=Streptomyces sp. NPDC088812 TaxID=3365905 RepID=UPI00382A53A3
MRGRAAPCGRARSPWPSCAPPSSACGGCGVAADPDRGPAWSGPLLVFGPAARGGYQQNRLVLVGVGVAAGTTALISLLVVLTDPFDATKALTWLSGSTYGRTLPDVAPVCTADLLGRTVIAAEPTLVGP